MNARMRRLASDWEQIQKDFAGHKNIIVTPEGTEPPEKYHVTYFVNGIYLLPDGRIETLGRHEVEITLHADYPRYKPICKILTPIWHPNFRDGQICIGDIWGAGESLTDIIINIGDMIQYKSWNSSSPLSADAADWALQNKHLFPVGTIDLYIADKGSENNVEIDLLDEPAPEVDSDATELPKVDLNKTVEEKSDGNDFEITAEELEGVEFIPTVQRMQSSASPNGTVKGKINIKTVITKGILWALMGAVVGFGMSEITDGLYSTRNIAKMGGNTHLAEYYDYQEEIEDKLSGVTDEYHQYCEEKGYDKDDTEHLVDWYNEEASDSAKNQLDEYIEISEKADSALYDSYKYEFSSSEKKLKEGIAKTVRTHSAIWSAIIALFVGLFLGIGEGVFYGSKEKALKYTSLSP